MSPTGTAMSASPAPIIIVPFLDAVEVARHALAGGGHRRVQGLHGRLDPGRVLRERVLHRDDDAESEISVHVRLRSISSRSKASCRSSASTNSRRTESGSARVSEKLPVEPAVGEEKRVPYKRTPGNKKPGSASSRVRMRVPQDWQSVSTVVSIPASTRSISCRRALRSRIDISFMSFLVGGVPSTSMIRISMAEEMEGSLSAASRFSLWPSR
ncbi:MAG: hypothetical protein MZV70_52085 [Desulfobacterales bacterium]|nr:hypothetical protein [Desulfobacterales bacterium]